MERLFNLDAQLLFDACVMALSMLVISDTPDLMLRTRKSRMLAGRLTVTASSVRWKRDTIRRLVRTEYISIQIHNLKCSRTMDDHII